MPEPQQGRVLGNDVFELTAKGQAELQGSGTALAPEEIELLVLLDGKATVGETAARIGALSVDSTFDAFGKLYRAGLIDLAKDEDVSLDFVDFFETKGPATSTAAVTAKGKKQAAATVALLHEKGYSVRIARRAKHARKAERERVLSVLVIEDEPHLAGLLKHVLASDGFEVRMAKNRDEIVTEFRRPPIPDLVLLDVVLPDANGFDVLARMRQHPALRNVPVVMLTSQATRDAVLKGLTGGADGYITKPFRVDALEKAVAAVLGLPGYDVGLDEKADPWSF